MEDFSDIDDILGIVTAETLDEALAAFETIGMPARNLSARTREEYLRDLSDMLEFLKARGIHRFDQVGLEHLEAYLAEMDRRGYESSTRRRKVFAIKTFFYLSQPAGHPCPQYRRSADPAPTKEAGAPLFVRG